MKMKTISLVVLGLLMVNSGSAPSADAPQPARGQPAVASGSVFFQRDVMPLVNRMGCNSLQCHGSPLGKGGLALSLFGGDPEEDCDTIAKAQQARRIDRMEPAKSLLLLKTTAAVAHGGGKQIQPASPQYKMLLAWIEQGRAVQ